MRRAVRVDLLQAAKAAVGRLRQQLHVARLAAVVAFVRLSGRRRRRLLAVGGGDAETA